MNIVAPGSFESGRDAPVPAPAGPTEMRPNADSNATPSITAAAAPATLNRRPPARPPAHCCRRIVAPLRRGRSPARERGPRPDRTLVAGVRNTPLLHPYCRTGLDG